MDVKTGNGAFMATEERSKALARSIVEVGTGAGLSVTALLTDMNQSLAPFAGNALEVRCAIDYLTGKSRPSRLHEVTMALCAEGLVAGKLAKTTEEARKMLEKALDSGAAAERFAKMVELLGGPIDLMERPDDHLAKAPRIQVFASPRSGFIQAFDTRTLGLAVVTLGGGRLRSDQEIDPAVGFGDICELGAEVKKGDPLLMIHARSEASAEAALRMISAAITIGDTMPVIPPLVPHRITAQA